MIFGNEDSSLTTTIMNLSNDMCRVCMVTSEYLKDIISFELTSEIVNMLSSFANINISINDCLPSLICNNCYTRLMDSINFRNLIIESNTNYNNYLSNLQHKSEEVQQENTEIPPPKSASPSIEIITIKEPKRNGSESENVEHVIKNNEFLNELRDIKVIEFLEPPSEFLNALGLMKGTNSEDSKDCINIITPETINNNEKKCKKSYKCKVCRIVLQDYGVLRRHLAAHGERPFTCKICGQRFSKARLLKEHTLDIHSGSRPYSCTQCTSKFITLNDLTVHLRKHAGNTEPHICPMCPRRFATAKQLREHSASHDSERKPFEKYKKTATGYGEHVCNQCERRFRKKCDLERHERVHSGEKPFSCTICGGRFQQAHNLTKHMVTHTGIRSFTCDICQKTFGRSDVLARHMHVHEVSKPFSCEHCSRTFARQSQLNSHLSKKHPTIEN